MIYNYFISYTMDNGSGVTYVERNKKIKSSDDIDLINVDLIKWLKDNGVVVEKVFINNFKLLNWKFGRVKDVQLKG